MRAFLFSFDDCVKRKNGRKEGRKEEEGEVTNSLFFFYECNNTAIGYTIRNIFFFLNLIRCAR